MSNSLPFGVALDSLVDVIGLTSVPERSVPGKLGSRKVGGRVLLVRDPAGRTGTLHDPASARAPRPSTVGAVGALSGLGAE